jgi:hypothetical protein
MRGDPRGREEAECCASGRWPQTVLCNPAASARDERAAGGTHYSAGDTTDEQSSFSSDVADHRAEHSPESSERTRDKEEQNPMTHESPLPSGDA